MKSNGIKTLVAVLCAAVLSGCVFVAGNETGGREADWQQRERENRQEIERLATGMTISDVRARMLHSPAFSEALTIGDDEYRVLFYRTHRTKGDSKTTRDETTPLVFTNGVLTGWGETAYMDLTGRPLAE